MREAFYKCDCIDYLIHRSSGVCWVMLLILEQGTHLLSCKLMGTGVNPPNHNINGCLVITNVHVWGLCGSLWADTFTDTITMRHCIVAQWTLHGYNFMGHASLFLLPVIYQAVINSASLVRIKFLRHQPITCFIPVLMFYFQLITEILPMATKVISNFNRISAPGEAPI